MYGNADSRHDWRKIRADDRYPVRPVHLYWVLRLSSTNIDHDPNLLQYTTYNIQYFCRSSLKYRPDTMHDFLLVIVQFPLWSLLELCVHIVSRDAKLSTAEYFNPILVFQMTNDIGMLYSLKHTREFLQNYRGW
jgi:hypothetical protein